MFTAGLFEVAEDGSNRVTIDKCVDKQEVVSHMIQEAEYYSALTRNAILIHVTTWINPGRHCAKWQQPDTKEQILYDSTCMWFVG